MHPFELTRALVDIESITGNELNVGDYLFEHLKSIQQRFPGHLEKMEVEPGRNNTYAQWGQPCVTFSTHIDTVPPFFPSTEDDLVIRGRGACDTKGIIASMITAITRLLEAGHSNVGMLLVVGEERNSAGAFHAARHPRGSKFLVNGEPTENRLAVGSKGALRYEVTARGRMAHSAYPELGESAIDKLLDVLAAIRQIELPVDPDMGDSTLNIGTLTAGRAPNVIADFARAEILIRLVCDASATRAAIETAAFGRAELKEVLMVDAVRMGTLPGFETMVAKYTTDIPAFNGAWGRPYLIGPGTIHVAHTPNEHIPKTQILEAVELYQKLFRQLAV